MKTVLPAPAWAMMLQSVSLTDHSETLVTLCLLGALCPGASPKWALPKVAWGFHLCPVLEYTAVEIKIAYQITQSGRGRGVIKHGPSKGGPRTLVPALRVQVPSSCTSYVVNVRQYHDNPGSLHIWPHCRRMLLFVWRRNDRMPASPYFSLTAQLLNPFYSESSLPCSCCSNTC